MLERLGVCPNNMLRLWLPSLDSPGSMPASGVVDVPAPQKKDNALFFLGPTWGLLKNTYPQRCKGIQPKRGPWVVFLAGFLQPPERCEAYNGVSTLCVPFLRLVSTIPELTPTIGGFLNKTRPNEVWHQQRFPGCGKCRCSGVTLGFYNPKDQSCLLECLGDDWMQAKGMTTCS